MNLSIWSLQHFPYYDSAGFTIEGAIQKTMNIKLVHVSHVKTV